ncbi:hypothetical protein BDA99DRAFT_557143 [Phascolomyces articulosus]|uniref:Uncharacterized protein n=1 Tax=Phascolomyces articulosus TaxID=60185 RepID=A0AAD5KIW0_9FUNG|nr:hypothetical protein BDA99DRAFT_557143 [Phascolomyces articulosus]
MHVTTTYVTNNQPIDNDNLTIRKEDLPPSPDDTNDGDNEDKYYLCIFVQQPGTSDMKRIRLIEFSCNDLFVKEEGFAEISKELKQLSRFMEIKKENLCWYHNESDDYDGPIQQTTLTPTLQHIWLAQCQINFRKPFQELPKGLLITVIMQVVLQLNKKEGTTPIDDVMINQAFVFRTTRLQHAGNWWRPFDPYNNVRVEQIFRAGARDIIQVDGFNAIVNGLNLTIELNGAMLAIVRQ